MAASGIGSMKGIAEILPLMLETAELRHQRQWPAALARIDRALAINPRFIPLYIERAAMLAELGRYEEALDSYDQFLKYAPPSPAMEADRAAMLGRAVYALDMQLDKQPADFAARLHRAHLLRKSGRYAEALRDYERVLALAPDHADALNNTGTVLLALHRPREAADAYVRATASNPARPEFWYNLGNVFQQLGELGKARAAYRHAIDLFPDFAEAHLELAHCSLFEGDPAGWPLLEWRWRTRQLKDVALDTPQPLWLGQAGAGGDITLPNTLWPIAASPGLAGKHLLVWAEQGAGDTLQFVRFVPDLLHLTDQLTLRVQEPLLGLLGSLDPRVRVIGDQEPLPPHDLHCPLMSLPLALGISAIPHAAAYLRADAPAIARWAETLGPRRGLRVGIAWAGRQFGLRNPTRDMPLSVLAPLGGLDIELISLQRDVPASDTGALGQLPTLRDLGPLLENFAQTAALIANLDLVISVDTAVGHLAAALGKPCWLMLRHSGEWRWQRERADSPWYRSMRIFRQAQPGNWAELVGRVLRALAEHQALAAAPVVADGRAGEQANDRAGLGPKPTQAG